MSDVVEFTVEDVEAMEEFSRRRHANADKMGTDREFNKFREDRVGGDVDGLKGEWAVADSLGLPRRADTSGVADPGYDLRVPTGGVQVRFTPHVHGRLMCPANKPLTAEWVVLVVGTWRTNAVEIVGGVSREEFYETCHEGDWGYGLTHYLAQGELRKWGKLKDMMYEG